MNGQRVVVTRSTEQAAPLSELLRRRGAEPLLYPCIMIAPPADPAALDAALTDALAGRFDWLVLTSSNTVLALAQRLQALGYAPAQLAGLAMAAVGPATAATARRLLGAQTQLVPDEFVAEALAAALQPIAGARVLLPQADLARSLLANTLSAAGAAVTSVVAYRTVTGQGGIDLPDALAAGRVDAVTFTSSSTVDNFLGRLSVEGGHPHQLRDVCVACLGPITAQTARAHGLTVAVTPASSTLDGLVAGLAAYFDRHAAGAP